MSLFSRSSVIILLVLLFPVVVTGAEPQPACATYGIDYQHTGQSPYVGPHEDAYVLWYRDWEGLYGKFTMDSNGNIYINTSNALLKYDQDGVLVNHYYHSYHGTYYSIYPAIRDDEQYILVKDYLINMDFSDHLQLNNGDLLVNRRIDAAFSNSGDPLLFGELYQAYMYRIGYYNQVTGAEEWSEYLLTYETYNERGYTPSSSPSGSIVCGDTYQYTSDGVQEWYYDVEGERTVDDDGNVYIAGLSLPDPEIMSLDSDGEYRWGFTNTNAAVISLHPDGFIVCNGQSMNAYNLDDGSLVWGPILDDEDYSGWEEKPVIDAEGYIFAYSDYYIQVLDSSGNHVCEINIDWDIIYPGGTYAPPIIAPNGNLYVAGTNGDPEEPEENLVCLQKYGT